MRAAKNTRAANGWPAIALAAFFLSGLGAAVAAAGLNILESHVSPRNRERPARRETRYIILHTTEGASGGALRKLSRNGEAHYLVDERGRIYRIVDHRRIAYHCGRSMWDGRTNLDTVSIGIEVAGYHNRDPSQGQIASLKKLIGELQRIYRIPDQRVLTHSMVAYGAPNRWHNSNHRGRKRCAMQFARWDIRRQLGLTRQPRFDPDVRAGRLADADPALSAVLYGSAREQDRATRHYAACSSNTIAPGRTAWDIARDLYNHRDTRYEFPDGRVRRGNEITNWRAIPPGTLVVVGQTGETKPGNGPLTLGKDGDSPSQIAGEAWRRPDTWYLYPDGRLVAGDQIGEAEARKMPAGTRLLVGYTLAGQVSRRDSAFDLSGHLWNARETFYLFPDNTLLTGDAVNENRIHAGTRILVRR